MMQAHGSSRGFTLIEILVMLVVIGITISFVTLSIGVGGRPVELQTEAEKLTGMLQLALEESVLTGKPMGLRIDEMLENDGSRFFYEWSVLEQGTWQALEQHPVLQDGQAAEGIELDLTLEGVDINLQQDKKDSEDDSALKESYQPDVFILQSGELTPFTLHISNPDLPGQVYRINGNPAGALRLLRPGDEDDEDQ
ncbi:MAG: type II secretion system minor pseudopilin GspH [Pseudomonadales bacterium]